MRIVIFSVIWAALTFGPASACGLLLEGKINEASALGASIETILASTRISEQDAVQIKNIQQDMKALAASGHETEARVLEEKAMAILGYRKSYLRCGHGRFAWMKIAS